MMPALKAAEMAASPSSFHIEPERRRGLIVQFQDQKKYTKVHGLLRTSKTAQRALSAFANECIQSTVVHADRWVERYRVMGAPFPGPASYKYHPWTREMMRSNKEENVGRKAAQMGFTEVVLNRALFTVVQLKRDVLYVLPAKTPDATDFSSARFDPALELSPLLNKAFTSTKNVGLKRAGANSLYIRGSRSKSGLKSIPVSLTILDEVEEFDDEAVALVRERQSGQNDFQLWEISTPSIPGVGIDELYERSDQSEFFFKCPCCGRNTHLIFPECLVITGESEVDPKINNSYIQCKECRGRLHHQDKWRFLEKGIWVPKYPDRDIFGPAVNQLYSSANACNPVRIAQAACRARVNVSDEQEFYNSKLGLPHVVDGMNVTLSHIKQCTAEYKMPAPHLLKGFLTLGIDVGSRCHFELTHWKFRETANSNDLNSQAFGSVVLAGFFTNFEEATELVLKFKPQQVVIDDMPDTRKSLDFARRFQPGYIKLCHYSSNLNTREIVDHGERVTVDRTTWLDLSLGRFINNTIALPLNIPHEYKMHLCALTGFYKKKKIDGKETGETIKIFKSAGDDHYGHARNYSEIALALCKGRGNNLPVTSRTF